MTEIILPSYVNDIINKLNSAGYLAFAVGGGVRDSILGLTPSDWDVTTSACPETIKSIFPHTADTGIRYGTVTVLYGEDKAEVTTFRTEKGYDDFRRPSEVGFSDSLGSDLERRDFTVNAIAYHPKLGIIDPMAGMADINSRLIRTVGKAEERFGEDALRILRAYRFKAQLGFEMESATRSAAVAFSHLLNSISRERIWQELSKTLLSSNPDVVFEMSHQLRDDSVKKLINGGFSLMQLPRLIHARLAGALFQYHLTSGDIEAIMTELKIDNDTMMKVKGIIGSASEKLPESRQEIKRRMAKYTAEIFRIGITLKEISGGADLSRIFAEVDEILTLKECYLIRDLAVTGDDLICSGFTEGKEIGNALTFLLDSVIDNPALNSKPILLSLLNNR